MIKINPTQNEGAGCPAQEENSADDAIFIGLGANLPSAFGTPRQTLQAALDRLPACGVTLLKRSRFWHSEPVPVSDQPWFVNAVVSIKTELGPEALLSVLHRIEDQFGRVRSVPNAPRLLDLDLLAYRRMIRGDAAPLLPHPRMAERAFVLLPLAEIAGAWSHPASKRTLADLIAALPGPRNIHPLPDDID